MASSDPLNWQCPNCNKNYSYSSSIQLRGSCSHDVCRFCITNLASLMEQTSTIEVRCPIDDCRRGRFHVKCAIKVSADVTSSSGDVKMKSEKKIKQEDTIDLCSTDDDADGLDRKPAAKRKIKLPEIKMEQTKASPKNDTSIKKEKTPETTHRSSTTSRKKSKIVSPLSSIKKTSNLKPLFNIGDKVTAAWWHPKLDPNQEGDPKGWYPGTIVSYKNIGTSEYGPTRTYHIRYDDGDELENIQDYWVFSRKDYDLSMRSQPNIGVKKRRDKQSNDMWAKKVGWYEINVGSEVKQLSFLSDAMKEYDDHVVQRDGKQTKKSHLNLPENYPSLFPEEGKVKIELKREEEETDDERFSGGEEESHKSSESKRRRLDHEKDKFMSRSILLLNTFINKDQKQNKGFGPFIKEGVAGCFARVPRSLLPRLDSMGQNELRDALKNNKHWFEGFENRDGGASQTALWLKEGTAGNFVIMRHEYPKCPYMPSRLKPNGTYIGSIYVIGMITKQIPQWSEEDTQIANRLCDTWKVGNLCLVDWKYMGMKDDLKQTTQGYINAVCQPTVAHICTDRLEPYKKGGTPESVREDLWNNANIMIKKEDFANVQKMTLNMRC